MKFVLTCLFLITSHIIVLAQSTNKNVELGLRYPIPVGDNFINKANYIGLGDIGIGYSFLNTSKVGLGVKYNSTVLQYRQNKVTLSTYSPKIKLDYRVNINNFEFIPQLLMGFSVFRFSAPAVQVSNSQGTIISTSGYENRTIGLTLGTATKFILKKFSKSKLYLDLSYEFTQLQEDAAVINSSYNRNIHFIYPGFGAIFSL